MQAMVAMECMYENTLKRRRTGKYGGFKRKGGNPV